MYHFNGSAWVRLGAPATTNVGMANFHGINTGTVANCSFSSPVTSTSKILEDDKNAVREQISRDANVRRAPLKQLFPRTPTPFKKAYAAAVQKGGRVEQLDLEKSPELFEDLQEIIFQDVVLPPAKRCRRPVKQEIPDEMAIPSCSYSNPFRDRGRAPSDDQLLDTTTTPSKILNDSSFLLSPPFRTDIPGDSPSKPACLKSRQSTVFVEPEVPPAPFTPAWYQIACGQTPAQIELTSMASQFLRRASATRELSM